VQVGGRGRKGMKEVDGKGGLSLHNKKKEGKRSLLKRNSVETPTRKE